MTDFTDFSYTLGRNMHRLCECEGVWQPWLSLILKPKSSPLYRFQQYNSEAYSWNLRINFISLSFLKDSAHL